MLNRKIIPYDPKLTQYARNLRKVGTFSEVLLWKELQGKKLQGYRFRRQKPIDNYIVDFYCHELKLAIEIDGVTHGWKEKHDEERQKKLESLGIRFLRFTESQFRENTWAALEEITNWIKINKKKEEE
ncbi:MAG: DUF559 domain-containing protein [Patescibacteria group bacterium]|nr:DUF559 domain-containing protein [Patescibacteria group bacterium]